MCSRNYGDGRTERASCNGSCSGPLDRRRAAENRNLVALELQLRSARVELRHYQRLALDTFEGDRARGGLRQTHIVAPPGSGKTVMGLEIARRIGAPAVVLCPTVAIQAQWAAHDAGVPLTALTYQAVCQTSDPEGALRAAAEARWEAEQVAAGTQAGTASRRRAKEIARLTATIKREVARHGAADLLSPNAHAVVGRLLEQGVGTVILDECHHLVSMWGYLIRHVLDALGEHVHVVGLTATSPHDMTEEEAELYEALLGPVDFETPTPAVVRDGYLAPFQELALFTTPLDSELAWLRDRHVRFQELLDRLMEVSEDELSFPLWVSNRMRHRGAGEAELSFAELLLRQPLLARAGLRYLHAAELPAPPGAPHGEGFREAPTMEDWVALISDYALRCLRAHPGEAGSAERRLDELAVGLADLGFTLTRTGVRAGRSDIDRVLVSSSAKPILACEALAAELDARAGELRAVVMCDSERPPARPEGSPLELGGGGRGLVATIAADGRLAITRPLLVTGTTFACAAGDAPALEAELRARGAAPTALAPSGELVEFGGLASRVGLASGLLRDGWTRCIVGTRGLLGEGWDAPSVNCLVDVTSVAASISTRQLRGRSLRLDPADPAKTASNWDIVCVAPELERGVADYSRFVRRHSHLLAPCEDGSIESGVSHVHPDLSPYAPPPAEAFAALNASGPRPRGRARGSPRALADRRALPSRRAARPAGAQAGSSAAADRPRRGREPAPAAAPALVDVALGPPPALPGHAAAGAGGARGRRRPARARGAGGRGARQPGVAAARRRLRPLPAARGIRGGERPLRRRARGCGRTGLEPSLRRLAPARRRRRLAPLRPRLAPRAGALRTQSRPCRRVPPRVLALARARRASLHTDLRGRGDRPRAGGRRGGDVRPPSAPALAVRITPSAAHTPIASGSATASATPRASSSTRTTSPTSTWR